MCGKRILAKCEFLPLKPYMTHIKISKLVYKGNEGEIYWIEPCGHEWGGGGLNFSKISNVAAMCIL